MGFPHCSGPARRTAAKGFLPGRLEKTAEFLEKHPLAGLREAYRQAVSALPLSAEKPEEKAVMDALFAQLGTAPPPCGNRRRPAPSESCGPFRIRRREQAEKGGKLLMQLGLLFGLMAGIALW